MVRREGWRRVPGRLGCCRPAPLVRQPAFDHWSPAPPASLAPPALAAALAWHRDSFYVYAAAEHAAVQVFHVGSGKLAAALEGAHRVNVRDLDVDHGRNLLATCSFDKSVAVHACAADAAA